MATRKSSSKPKLVAVPTLKAIDEAREKMFGRVDNALAIIQGKTGIARALADALKVLTALERCAGGERPGQLVTGDGYADGHAVCDATMPELAAHLFDLLDDIDTAREALDEIVRGVDATAAEAANG